MELFLGQWHKPKYVAVFLNEISARHPLQDQVLLNHIHKDQSIKLSNLISPYPTTYLTIAYPVSRKVGTWTSCSRFTATGAQGAWNEIKITRTALRIIRHVYISYSCPSLCTAVFIFHITIKLTSRVTRWLYQVETRRGRRIVGKNLFTWWRQFSSSVNFLLIATLLW